MASKYDDLDAAALSKPGPLAFRSDLRVVVRERMSRVERRVLVGVGIGRLPVDRSRAQVHDPLDARVFGGFVHRTNAARDDARNARREVNDRVAAREGRRQRAAC